MSNQKDGTDKRTDGTGSDSCPNAVIEAWDQATRLERQVEVVTYGILAGGTTEFGNEIRKHPGETALNAGLSLSIGAGLAYLQRKYKVAAGALGTVAGLFGLKCSVDTVQRLGKDKDLQAALQAAWLTGDKMTMERSKAAAVKTLSPEVVQFEVGAVAGFTGYGGSLGVASLRSKSFAQSWSSIMGNAIKSLRAKNAQANEVLVNCKPATGANKIEAIGFECDERGRALVLPTDKEQAAVLDALKHMNELGATKLRYVLRSEHEDIRGIDVGVDKWELGPERECQLGAFLGQISKRIESCYGLEFRIRPSTSSGLNGRYLSTKFVPENLLSEYKWSALLEADELVRKPAKGIDDYGDNLPIARMNDIERLVLEGFIDYLRKARLPVSVVGAHRTMGPSSGRTIEPLIVELKDAPEGNAHIVVAEICESLYKQFRCRVGFRATGDKHHGYFGDGSVPLDVRRFFNGESSSKSLFL